MASPPSPKHSPSLQTSEPQSHELQQHLSNLEKGPGQTSEPKNDLPSPYEEPIPDGGLAAWTVAIGAAHIPFATLGFTNAWGAFQEYYASSSGPLSRLDASTISWIGSLQYCLIFLPNLAVGVLLDRNLLRVPFITAGYVYVVAIFLTAQCKVYWQFVLCQGVLWGLASGVIFGPSASIMGHWFDKNRALAMGVVTSGSSIGGTIFPIMVRRLIPLVGFPWTMRICGFVILYAVTVSAVTVRGRLPPVKREGGVFNVKVFKSWVFSLYTVGIFLCLFGLYTPLTYIDTFAISKGIGSYSYYLLSICNASSFPGRIIPAMVADKIGSINTLLPTCLLLGVMIFAWPYCTTVASVTVCMVLYGIGQGAFVSLFASSAAQLGSKEDVGRRMGMVFTVISFAQLAGPPVSGAILTATGDWLKVAGFAGGVVFAGMFALGASRAVFLKGKLWGKI